MLWSAQEIAPPPRKFADAPRLSTTALDSEKLRWKRNLHTGGDVPDYREHDAWPS